MKIGRHDGGPMDHGGAGDGRDDPAAVVEASVDRVLGERDVDPGEALVELVRVIVNRHLDCQRHRSPRFIGRPTPGNERPNALTGVMDAIFQQTPSVGPFSGGPAAAPGAGPLDRGTIVRQTLWALLLDAQLAAERAAGMTDDEDDEGEADGEPQG